MSRDRRQPALALAAALVVPVLLAFATGLATVHPCIPASGGWAQAGLRLALLAPSEACPQGTWAAGATSGQVLTVVVAVAVPVLLAHLALVTGIAALLGSVRAVLVAAARRLVARILPAPVGTAQEVSRRVVVTGRAVHRVAAGVVLRPYRRGPPRLLGVGG